MPLADAKQQVSFLNGQIWMSDGETADARDKTMEAELKGQESTRSANLYRDPLAVAAVYGYDVVGHAEWAVSDWERRRRIAEAKTLAEKGGWRERKGVGSEKDALGIDAETRWKYMGWFEKGVGDGSGGSKL